MSFSSRESGQAAVETALTMPLLLFVIMGTLQWGMLMQARNLAQYAVYRATRAGSLNHGDCQPMMHSAIASLIPSFVSFTGRISGAGTNGQKLGNVFRRVGLSNRFDAALTGGQAAGGFTESIVWLAKERPLEAELRGLSLNRGEYSDWDQGLDAEPIRLEVRMVYWYPLRLPFIDWVLSRMMLAHWGLLSYDSQLPYMSVRQAPGGAAAWNYNPYTAFAGDYWQADILNELVRRHNMRQYSFPISVSSRMRMMTPPRVRFFTFGQMTCGYP